MHTILSEDGHKKIKYIDNTKNTGQNKSINNVTHFSYLVIISKIFNVTHH